MILKIKYFSPKHSRLREFENGDWVDLMASETIELKKFESALIPLGVAMKLPYGYEGYVIPRSSTFKNFGIIQTNGIGIIDESYCGNNDEWKMPVLALRDTIIHAGDRICQFRIQRKMKKPLFKEVDNLQDKDRGGFGSTGIN